MNKKKLGIFIGSMTTFVLLVTGGLVLLFQSDDSPYLVETIHQVTTKKGMNGELYIEEKKETTFKTTGAKIRKRYKVECVKRSCRFYQYNYKKDEWVEFKPNFESKKKSKKVLI